MDEIVDVNTLFGPLPLASNDLTVESLLELMGQNGVGTACALSTLGWLLDPAVGNAVTKNICAQNPSLLPVATFNPAMYYGDKTALIQAKADGFRLVRFFPDAQNWPLDFAPFRALLSDLRETNLPIVVGVCSPGDITGLARVLGDYSAPVIIADAHPGLLAECLVGLREHANWHLELSSMLAPGCLKAVVDAVGASRLLFGSNAPSHPIVSALDTLQFAELSDADKQQVLSGNARRILNM